MSFAWDPEVVAAIHAFFGGSVEPPAPAVGDVATRRQSGEALLARADLAQQLPDDVLTRDFHATTPDGYRLLLRWYAKEGTAPGSAVLYLHGGGMILGSVGLYDGTVSRLVSASGVPFLSVEYRLAPEFPHPTPIEDAFAGLSWLAGHTAELGVDPGRIAVMGDSAGGGMAAGYAAPARMKDAAGLPPLYMEALELDIFRDEDIAYARRTAAAGVSTELHAHRSVPHGFDAIAFGTAVARRQRADRIRVLQEL